MLSAGGLSCQAGDGTDCLFGKENLEKGNKFSNGENLGRESMERRGLSSMMVMMEETKE